MSSIKAHKKGAAPVTDGVMHWTGRQIGTIRNKQNCPELIEAALPTAEAELAAFLSTVRREFGPEEVYQSAEDWIEALKSEAWSFSGRCSNWRSLTIFACARLAARVNSVRKG